MDNLSSYIWFRLLGALLVLGLIAWNWWAEGLEVFFVTILLPVSAAVAFLVSMQWVGEAALAAFSSDALRKVVADKVAAAKPQFLKEAEAAQQAAAA